MVIDAARAARPRGRDRRVHSDMDARRSRTGFDSSRLHHGRPRGRRSAAHPPLRGPNAAVSLSGARTIHLQALGMVCCGVERGQHATRWFAIHAPEVPCPLECHWTTLLGTRVGREPEVLEGFWYPAWIQEMHYALLAREDASTVGIHHNTPWTDGFLRVLVRCLTDETFRVAAMTVARLSGRDAVFDLYQRQSSEGP